MTVIEEYMAWEDGLPKNHQGHAFASEVLAQIEKILPEDMACTAETGCGKSTILFSNTSKKHYVFALDDRSDGVASSVNFYRMCPLTQQDRIIEIFGPTQITLPKSDHSDHYDCVLIDGPHGFPFPEIEYGFFYPKIKTGGLLILDDVAIPTIGRMADILCEDDMWNPISLIGGNTLVLERTDSPLTNPVGDEWWTQKYNRRRVSKNRDISLNDGKSVDLITSMNLDSKLHGG